MGRNTAEVDAKLARAAASNYWTEAEAQAVLEAYEASGLSVAEFARRHGLACVHTLVATRVLAEVETWAYLADVLEKLARGWSQRRLEELLPPRWKGMREAAAQPPSTAPTAT